LGRFLIPGCGVVWIGKEYNEYGLDISINQKTFKIFNLLKINRDFVSI
jgi:hypothetical protein